MEEMRKDHQAEVQDLEDEFEVHTCTYVQLFESRYSTPGVEHLRVVTSSLSCFAPRGGDCDSGERCCF